MALDIILKAGTGGGASESSLKLETTPVPAKSKRIALPRGEKGEEDGKDSDGATKSGDDESSMLSEIASALTDEDKDSDSTDAAAADRDDSAAAADRDAAAAADKDAEEKPPEAKPESEVRRNPKIRVTRTEKRPPGQGEGTP